MTDATLMHSHGDVLANLPGILGYFPTDSVVLAFYTSNSDTIDDLNSLTLGPCARMDLGDALTSIDEDAVQFATFVLKHNLVAVAAYVIGSGNAALDVADEVAALLHDHPAFPPLLSVVIADEISTDASYAMRYTHPMIDAGPVRGHISNVAASATLRDMVQRTGNVPELHRDSMMSRITSTDHGIDPGDYAQLLFDVASFSADEKSYTALQRIYEAATRGINGASDIATIRAGMQCFTSPCLRDPLLAALIEAADPQHSMDFIETLMRAVPAEWHSIRAQVTATFAMLAYAAGQPGLAAHAAHEAVELAPNNSYANLIAKVLDVGKGDALLHSAVTGGRLARTELFEGYITAVRPQSHQ